MASEYLKKEGEIAPSEPSTNPEPEVKLENCKIEDDKLIIAPGTTLDQLNGAVLEGTTLGTGAKITANGTTYTLVVLGDASGDGKISPADYVRVKNQIMGTIEMDTITKKAADVNCDGKITPADYVQIKNHIMNVKYISI